MTLKAFSDAQIQSALDRSNAIEKRKIDQVNSLTPAQHATTINIAGRTGLPRDLVERNQELLEKRVKEKDQRTLLEKFPALKNVYLNDRNLGGLLQNDAQSLFDATKSAFFDTGVGFDMPDGSRRYFTRRPTAEDFPITADGGFAKSSADLRMAQERWDGRNGSLGNGIAAGSYFALNQRQRSMEEMDDLVGDSLAYGYERFKRIYSNNLDESGLFDGLYEQQRRVAEANGIYYNRNQDRAIREANRQRELEALMPSLEVQAQMQQISETKTIGQAIQAMVRNPKAATVMYFQSLGTTAPAMAITLAGFSAGGAPGGVVATALGSFSIEYGATIEGTMLEYGLNPDDAKSWETYFENEELLAHAREKAVQRGIPIALFDAATAGIAGRFIRNADPSASSFLPRAGAEMAVQAGGGAGGEATAQYVSGEEYKPADIVLEAFAELPTAVPEAFGNYVAVRVKSESCKEIEDNRAKNAVENASLLRQVVGLLSNSEALKQGDAGRKAVAEVLNQSAPDETVTISARETQRILQENNIPLQSLNEAAPSLVRQLPDALSVGGDVVINRGELIGAFAQTPAMEPLIEHVRMTPDAMTLAESQEYAQSGDEKLAAEMDALATRLADDEIFQASKNRVYDTVLAQLNLANRFTSAKNEVDAALISAYFSTRASQLGVMPEELLNETGFNVRAEGVPDQVLDQDFIGTPDGTVKFSRKRFAQLFSEHMYPDGQVHAAVAFINPQDFVNATTVGREEAQTIADDVADEPTDMAKMQQDILPYLDVEVGENGAVRLRNHEGRHRMQRLADAGYTRVPVRFVNRDAEYGDRSLLGLPQNGEIGGQRFYDGETSESALPYENLIEITPDNRQLLLDTFEASESDVFMQSASLRRGSETLKRFGLDPNKVHKTRDVAAALEARQRQKYGSIDRTDRSKEAVSKIAKWMVEEVLFELQNPEASGVGWYSTKFQNALDTMGEVFPELLTEKSARDLMTALIAITSDGQKVVPNFTQAMGIYGNFKDTGKFSANRGTQRQASVNNNLKVLQRLYDEMGPEVMHEYLMQEKSISELKKIAKENGGEMKSDYQAHIQMPMAAVEFGPKLGAFYANLMGAHGYLTMDRWWSRTFNRYRGTLLTKPTQAGLDRFRELLGQPGLSDDEVIAATVEYRNAYADRNYKNGSEIEKAANTIYKAAFEALEDAPFTATDRTFMLDAVNRAQSNLKRRGYNVSVADIQAILWYYEKRLYGELGARQSADISYEEAARQVATGYASGSGSQSISNEQGRSRQDGQAAQRTVPVGEELYQEGGQLDQESRRLQSEGFQQGIGRRGSFEPTTNTIRLLQSADLSTFLHEAGHYFFENDIAMASRLVGKDELTLGEQQIVDDVHKLLNWHGFEGPVEEQINTWYSMTLDQKRGAHEKTAESFERYLFSG